MLGLRKILTRPSFQRLQMYRNITTAGFGKLQQKVPENKPPAKQVNIYEQKSDLIEGSKIKTYIQKKEVGLTDDESTTSGKIKAKSKDLTSILFIGGAAFALGYCLWDLWTSYFKKNDEDYAYEIAQKVVRNCVDLGDNLGVDFEIATTDKKGNRQWGDKVSCGPVQMNDDIGLEMMPIVFFARNSTRSCLIRAFMVKKEGDSPDKFFPMLIFGELDYEQKYYSRKIFITDYREELKKHIDLDILRKSFADDQEATAFAIEAVKNDTQSESSDTITAFGSSSSGTATASSGITNFAASTTSDSSTTSSSSATTTESSSRLRPKW